MNIIRLRTEYLENPLGIDVRQPRLSYELQSERQAARQSAYQLLVASSPQNLDSNTGDLWDTGKVQSSQSTHIVYQGKPLHSAQRAWWKVQVWDENNVPSGWSSPAWFEMGLLNRSDWKARWIGTPLSGGNRASVPVPFLRKEITLSKPVASARLYVTALGVYEFHINGQRIGADYFTPGWTDYHKRIQYQVYDITANLQPGVNALGAMLGDGWYCGHIAWRGRQAWGDRPRLFAQLSVTFADGTQSLFLTDRSWNYSFGPILESDFLMGEVYDARKEFPGWDTPGFDMAGWQPVMLFDPPAAQLVSMRAPTVQKFEELSPIAPPRKLGSYPAPSYIFDLGQNMVGWVRLKVQGPAGTTIRLRFAEILDENGDLYTINLRSARATDYYTLKGEGVEIYEPRFTFHGFRYVQLDYLPGEPQADTVTGIVLHSAIPQTGTFECSDPLINQLQHNIWWGQKGNFVDVPTDCPQRDERLGWTGDAQVFCRTAAFNADVASFFTRWMNDYDDAQSDLGQIPPVVPNFDGELNRDGGPAWADAVLIIPWTIYLTYGDTRILADHYNTFVKYIEYLTRNSPGYIRCHPETQWEPGGWTGFEDWLNINAVTPPDLIGTAFFAYSARLLSQIAAILGKPRDAAKYQKLFESIRSAFQNRFVTREGLVVAGTQTAYVLALQFDLLPESLRPIAARELQRDIKKRGSHLSTGFVGSSYLPHVLTQNGLLDVQYELLHQKSWPSWLYAVTQGATTIWERWDGWTHDKGFQDPGMNSFNHYAYGAIGAWLYQVVAGIEIDPSHPGYQHILFKPQPGGGLQYAKASIHTLYGLAASHWWYEESTFHWKVTIPVNTTATACVPCTMDQKVKTVNLDGSMADLPIEMTTEGYARCILPSGTYIFTVQ